MDASLIRAEQLSLSPLLIGLLGKILSAEGRKSPGRRKEKKEKQNKKQTEKQLPSSSIML